MMRPMTNKWWRADEKSVADDLVGTVRTIMQQQSGRRMMDLRHACLFGNMPVAGLSPWSYSRHSQRAEVLSMNVIENIAGAVQAKLSQTRPRPMFLTSGGTRVQRQKAKSLTKFSEAVFYETRQFQTSDDVMLDTIVFGTGVQKQYEENGRICHARLMPFDVYVDDADGYQRSPRAVYHVQWVDRGVLWELYPDARKNIERAERVISANPWDGRPVNATADVVQVVEAWRLPDGEPRTEGRASEMRRALGGRHTMAVSSGYLVDEPWTKPYLPIAVMRWMPRIAGWYGKGLVESLASKQTEVNRLMRHIQRSLRYSGLKAFVHDSAQVDPEWLTDQLGLVIRWNGNIQPSFAPVQTVAPEVFQQLQWIVAQMFEMSGVSRLQAQGQVPLGIKSGRGLRTLANLSSERFLTQNRAWEEFHLEVARQDIGLALDILERGDNLSVRYLDKHAVAMLDAKDVFDGIEEDEFALKVFPTNALSTNPSERMEDVLDLANAGWITPATAKRLLDFPDLESEMQLEVAPREVIERTFDKILDDGEFHAPDPFMPLELGIEVAKLRLQQAQLEEVDPERIELLRQWIENATDLMAPPPPPPPPSDAEAPPMAEPALPPTPPQGAMN